MRARPTKINHRKVLSAGPPLFIDLFAGCGGLSLGLMQSGWKGLFAVEHDAFAFQTLHDNLVAQDARYQFAWPKWLPKQAWGVDDILSEYRRELKALDGQIDMVVGGPPCQGFSSAGRRDPSDPRNRLVEAYLEFVEIVKPKLVLIENVRGITTDFKDETVPNGKVNYAAWLTASLSKRYKVSSKMIDTSTFGVPQRRHRYFVIGVRKDIAASHAPCPFTAIEDARGSFLSSKGIFGLPVSAKAAIADLTVKRNGTRPSRDTKDFDEIKYRSPLTSYQRIMNEGQTGPLPDTRLARHNPEIVERFKKIIEICHETGRLNTSLSPEMRASFGLRKCAIRVLDPESPAPTITSMPDDLIHYSEPRTLTVRENARLQSFPDWFAFKGKYTTGGERRRREVPRFTQVANAVPPLVAEGVGTALLQYLSKSTAAPQPSTPKKAARRAPDIREARL